MPSLHYSEGATADRCPTPAPPSRHQESPPIASHHRSPLPKGRKKKMRRGACRWLPDRRVQELVRDKHCLVEFPYTATLAHAVNDLVANRVAVAPVAAPPDRWIGAGGSLILESDPATGAVLKHYISMVTMLDVLVHIAEEVDGTEAARDASTSTAASVDLDKKMSVPVPSVIGHSLEGLSFWALNPNTRVIASLDHGLDPLHC